jgi:hypothetical protein
MALRFKKSGKIFFILIILGVGLFWLNSRFDIFGGQSDDSATKNPVSPSPAPFVGAPSTPPSTPALPQNAPSSAPSPPAPKSILQVVPFFAQAPFGEWSDPIFQNACEEASIIMAMHWVAKTSVTKEQAKQEIIALTEFEDRTYGPALDRAAEDAIKMFKDYYNYENVSLRFSIGAADIKAEILKGNLVIVPLDGRILANPYYTAPGPDHHMLVVIGYDGNKKEFITNDVGTRQGQQYRYSEARLQASLQDYPTGNDLLSTPGKTAMIVVMPK